MFYLTEAIICLFAHAGRWDGHTKIGRPVGTFFDAPWISYSRLKRYFR